MAGAHRPDVTAIPLGRPSPSASSNQPERQANGQGPAAFEAPRVAPIRFCSRRGLPCRRRCRPRGALLPHPFTLAVTLQGLAARDPAVCFLWRFPWGFPRRTLSGAASAWSPDFPPLRSGGRPADWLVRAYVAEETAVKRNRTRWSNRRASPAAGQGTEATARSLKLHANYGIVPRAGPWAARPAWAPVGEETQF